MNEEQTVEYLFDITKQIKMFYESPVVYVVYKDYSHILFKFLCSFHDALLRGDKKLIVDLILDSHLQWLYMVNEIEDFKTALEIRFPREKFEQLIDYTIETLNNRLRHYNIYMDRHRNLFDSDQHDNLKSESEIIEEMHKEVVYSLKERAKMVNASETELEYRVKVNEAADELLDWVDKVTDGFARKISKYIPVNIPQISNELSRPLQQIVYDIKESNSEAAQKMISKLKVKGSEIGAMVRFSTAHALETTKLYNKIIILQDRIERLEAIDKNKPSAGLEALKNKKAYLEKRVESIENLKTTLQSIRNITSVNVEDIPDEELCICEDFYALRIFNHILPPESRERLITELCNLWETAILGERRDKSMISILSATESREKFADELGTFYIDEYSRRIYNLPDDDALYQPNEHNELVRVCDDPDHIYYYDECGRYFVDVKTKQRIYKAHSEASEYMMDSSGVLLKVKEVKNKITYYYDNYGRYYIDNDGKNIYQDPDSTSRYENDGLGNLVRVRSHMDIFDTCPGDVNVTEDFKYLKETVGRALRECIGRVLLQQPNDPIKFLSSCLVNYRENLELRERRLRETEELNVEREIAIAEELAAAERAAREEALQTQGGSEASYDSNLIKYGSMDLGSADVSAVEPITTK